MTSSDRVQVMTKSSTGKAGIALFTAVFMALTTVNAAEPEPVRGVVKSFQEAVLSVDLNARVMETPIRAGEAFRKDDVLLTFDCEIQNAEAKAAKAAFSASRSAHKSNVELEKYGAIGEYEVGVSKAEMQQAQANAEAVTARTKDCVINAPFDGRVAELAINAFETPGPNQPLMKIVSSDEFEVRLIVPSNWLAWLKIGSALEFNVDETGKRHRASVWQIGAEVDAVSRTVAVVARFEKLPANVLPGMSGTAYFNDSQS